MEDYSKHPNYPLNILLKQYHKFKDVFSKTISERLPQFKKGQLDHRIRLKNGRQPFFIPL
jgi:hypothetical protein